MIRHFDADLEEEPPATVLGLITLSTDTVTEPELARMTPSGKIVVAATRIKTENPMTIEHLGAHGDGIAFAATLFDPQGAVRVYMYACTSGSAIASQESLEEKLRSAVPGARLTSPMTGALAAFETLGVRRLAMLTPYPDDVTAAVRGCIEASGREIASAGSFHVEQDYDVIRISPDRIVAVMCELNVPDAEACFIPCTGFRTATIIEELEHRLRKPVITAHQAMIWHALRLAGYREPIAGFGRLMSCSLPLSGSAEPAVTTAPG